MDKALEELEQAVTALCTYNIMLRNKVTKCLDETPNFEKAVCAFENLLDVLVLPGKPMPLIRYIPNTIVSTKLWDEATDLDKSTLNTLYQNVRFYPQNVVNRVKKLQTIVAVADKNSFDEMFKPSNLKTDIEMAAYNKYIDDLIDIKLQLAKNLPLKPFDLILKDFIFNDFFVHLYQIVANASRTNSIDRGRLQSLETTILRLYDKQNSEQDKSIDMVREGLRAEFDKRMYTEEQRNLFADLF